MTDYKEGDIFRVVREELTDDGSKSTYLYLYELSHH
jgi:hypothetical protein